MARGRRTFSLVAAVQTRALAAAANLRAPIFCREGLMTVCTHPGCTTCDAILVGQLAALLVTIPEVHRAALAVDALRLARQRDAEESHGSPKSDS